MKEGTNMLNLGLIMGRLTTTPELKTTTGGKTVTSFNVAVDRGKDKPTDFIPCVAWENTAEFIAKYFSKGNLICLRGTLQSRQYKDKNGSTHNVLELIISEVSFTGEKTNTAPNNTSQNNDYDDCPLPTDDDLPFN